MSLLKLPPLYFILPLGLDDLDEDELEYDESIDADEDDTEDEEDDEEEEGWQVRRRRR